MDEPPDLPTASDLAQRVTAVKEKDTLELGSHTLAFLMAPMVHWPEVMVSYDSSEKIRYQKRRVGIVENGSWAPSAGRVMKAMLEELKNVEIVEPMVTIRSSLNADSRTRLAELAGAMAK